MMCSQQLFQSQFGSERSRRFRRLRLWTILIVGLAGAGGTVALAKSSDGTKDFTTGAVAMWVTYDGTLQTNQQAPLFTLSDRDGPQLRFVLGVSPNLRADQGNESMMRVLIGPTPDHKRGSYFVPESFDDWHLNRRHHLILNWDANTGWMKAYVDGREREVVLLFNGATNFHQFPWTISASARLELGNSKPPGAGGWPGEMKQVKVFDHPLSPVEARAEFLRDGQDGLQVRTIDGFLYAGRRERCRLVFDNNAPDARVVTPLYEVTDEAGNVVQTGALGAVNVPATSKVTVETSFTLPRPGAYVVSLRFQEAGVATAERFGLRAVAAAREADEGDAKTLVPVSRVDAVMTQPVAESAPSKVVDSALGRYREAGERRHDRFVVDFKVKELGVPHIATITYPDDKPRTMEMVLQRLEEPGDLHDYQAQTGLFTGEEYPCSQTMQEHRVLFWPTAKHLAFIFMTVENGRPAAVSDIRIERLEGGFSRLAVESYEGSVPARRIGLYYEDPVLNKSFSAPPLFPGYEKAVDTLLDYMESFGQDRLIYPIAWYRGPLYGSEVEPWSGDIATRPHPRDYPRYLMKRLAQRGMTFTGGMHVHDLSSLLPAVILDDARVLAGEETPINMQANNRLHTTGWHESDPNYNPLDPQVQHAVKALMGEVAMRYGDEPAFTGVALTLPRHKLFSFGSLESGYNDINLRRFREDTGLDLPLNPGDPQRFSKAYDWLMENAREAWIGWRCARIHDYYRELADILSRQRADLKLTVTVFTRPEVFHERMADYASPEHLAADLMAESGIDPRLFANDKNIRISHTMVPADLRFFRKRGDTEAKARDQRTSFFAPDVTSDIRALPHGAEVNLHDRYFEDPIGRQDPLKGLGVEEVRWRVTTHNPGGRNALEAYAMALANVDALSITKGGYVIGTYGTEDVVGEFAQAYRRLPGVRFDDVPGLADPVRVRQQVVDGQAWFYVLNTLPVPVQATVLLRDEAPLELSLKPYELRSFHRESTVPVVSGGRVKTDPAFVRELEATLLEATARVANQPKAKNYLKLAQEHAQAGRYSRLYRLLQESWNAR